MMPEAKSFTYVKGVNESSMKKAAIFIFGDKFRAIYKAPEFKTFVLVLKNDANREEAKKFINHFKVHILFENF